MTHSLDLLQMVEDCDANIRRILSSNVAWYKKIDQVITIIVPKVEDIAQGWDGIDKKHVALQLIDDIWFKHFDLKYVPNFLEKKLVAAIASKGIDAFVKLMNEKGVFKHTPLVKIGN